MLRLRKPICRWEPMLPAGIWLHAANPTFEFVRTLTRSGFNWRRGLFIAMRLSGRLARAGFHSWRFWGVAVSEPAASGHDFMVIVGRLRAAFRTPVEPTRACDLLAEKLDAIDYPIRSIDVVTDTDDSVELAATLIPTTVDPTALDAACIELSASPKIDGSTRSVSVVL